uniref:Uncharacterized protein n=1 Tax=Meloidogyne incognita TaxID=6306 RepID=A0A914KHM3_MELIC
MFYLLSGTLGLQIPGDGKCLCYGYTGRICQFPCPGENYGLDCSDTCTCQSEATCDRYNGSRRSTLKGNNYLYIV